MVPSKPRTPAAGRLDEGEDLDLGQTQVAPDIEEALYLAECAKAAEAGLTES